MTASSRKELLDLIKRMKEGDESVTSLLAQFGALAVELLIPYLESGRVWPTAKVLVMIGEPAVEPLIRVLECEDVYGRDAAAWALGQLRDRRAVNALVGVLGSNDEFLQKEAAWALGRIKDQATAEPLIDFLVNCSEGPLEAADYAVSEMLDYTLDPLVALLKDSRERTRKRAISAIAWNTKAVDALIGALNDKSIYVRAIATRLLGFGKDKKAIGPLISALEEEDEYRAYLDPCGLDNFDTRHVSSEFDGKQIDGDRERRVTQLASGYEDFIDDYLLRLEIREQLICDYEFLKFERKSKSAELYGENDEDEECEDIGPESLEDDYQREPDYIISTPRMALVKMGEMAIEGLISALKSVNEAIRKHAAHALGELQAIDSTEPLVSLLNDDSVAVRENVVWALGCILAETRDANAIKVLSESVSDINTSVRAETALALGRVGDPLAMESLFELLDDDDLTVRESAIWALGKIRDERAVAPLIKLLEDESESLRLTAEAALVDIGSSAAKSMIELLSKKRQSLQEQRLLVLCDDDECPL